MTSFASQMHPSWISALPESAEILHEIEESLLGVNYSPEPHLVMKAFERDLNLAKVVIFGQDPYPMSEITTGQAFAIPEFAKKVPASLRNILREAHDDVGENESRKQDLSHWIDQGVLLVNRTLTISDEASNSHKDLGWSAFTESVAGLLGERGIVAILWGKSAQELRGFFDPSDVIQSVHPSPLSAYRGFFGSKPFTKVNKTLINKGLEPIDW